MEVLDKKKVHIFITFTLIFKVVFGITDPNDFTVLTDFRNGLSNSELLNWPADGNDPCGPPSWHHVYCTGNRVTQIQVQGLGLIGTLPQNFNQLSKLQNVGFQNNNFTGNLPSLSGLSDLQYAFLDYNKFDTIPQDFFQGLTSIQVLALDENPLNATTGWSLPIDLQASTQLINLSCTTCNINGNLPDIFGKFPSLNSVRLSYNRLSGQLPPSFRDSNMQILWLNDQNDGGMSGPIDVIGTMIGLTQVWLHGNEFTGPIPDSIGNLTSLQQLNLNTNHLVGLIPQSLGDMDLQLLDLNNNMFMGPIPNFKSPSATYSSNLFCQTTPGEPCAPEVNALLDFLKEVNYPNTLASRWTGNDPCSSTPWLGINCDSNDHVNIMNLQKFNLNGTLSDSLVNLPSLSEIHLAGNNLHGLVPSNLTQLSSLKLLDLTGNDFDPPLPNFPVGVKVITNGNPKLTPGTPPSISPPPISTPPPPISTPPPPIITPPPKLSPPPKSSPPPRSPPVLAPPPLAIPPPPPPPNSTNTPSPSVSPNPRKKKGSGDSSTIIIVAIGAGSVVLVILAIVFAVYCLRKKNDTRRANGIVVHPRDMSTPDDMVKITVSNEPNDQSNTNERRSSFGVESHIIEDGNLVISVQILRRVTNNFSQENELGRGGFGAVYKGELHGGTHIAVKRMESVAIRSKALDEFEAEIAVLSKVRHRHLVALLGYSAEGSERLLVYEYMPQGALSRHLFRWKSLNLEPLSWKTRLNIALDVARGLEYLHSLAHKSFIHRDLKSSNILLDDKFRAKVSDFGLVKLAPEKERSVVTRLAGTFGYLAPEYAVTGKITTKVDVFSFGVVLMELLTGMTALDEDRTEESRYLAEYFWQIKSDKQKLLASIDSCLDQQEIKDTVFIISELAGHCTTRDPNHRPEMKHIVSLLSPLVESWKPFEEKQENPGVDYTLPLPLLLKGWKEEEEECAKDITSSSVESKGSIPARPMGFADSFTADDAR